MMLRSWARVFRTSSLCLGGLGPAHGLAFLSPHLLRAVATTIPALFLFGATREGVYNILWGLVFAFATLNILALGARRFEANKRGLSFGEVLAIMIVLISIILLAWELLYQFNILPLRLNPE